jgi:adhesin transport system outer membrane protein
MIFDGLETPSRVEAAEKRQRSARMTLLDTRESLALRAAQAYVNLLRARNALGMIRAQKTKADDYVKRIGSMVNEGAADETELQQARDVQMTLKGLVVDYTGQARNALADYREAIGRPPEGQLTVPQVEMGAVPTKVVEALDYALDNHPALQAALYNAASSRHEIRAEKAALYPDINGELTYLKNDKRDIIGGEVVDAKAVLRMNWNFETGGGQLARIRKSKYQHRESEARKQETARQIERSVRMAYAEYDTASAQQETLNERVALNEKLFKAYESQFEGARINLLQLMQGDNQLFSTRLEEANARYRVMAAQFGILASLGLLQDALVAQPAVQAEKSSGDGIEQPAGKTQNGE